jgi:sugar/nucleoside kinase (ribokinase family)
MYADLLAVGLTTLDIVGYPIDTIPADEAGVLISGIDIVPAGTAAGFALVAAVLGMKAGLISALGDDRPGRFVRGVLEEHGVDTSLTPTLPGFPTSATILPIDSHGRRPTLHAPGASMLMELDDAAVQAASHARFVHWAAIGGRRIDAGQRTRFLQNASSAGAMVTCDLIAPAPDAAADLAEIAPAIDCFLPSLTEARLLTGRTEPADCAAALLAKGIPTIVIKLGAAGTLVATAQAVTATPAFKIDVVDTTSCGDAFCAGYVTAFSRGFEIDARIRFASAVAALVAQGLGTLGKLESFDQALAASSSMAIREFA